MLTTTSYIQSSNAFIMCLVPSKKHTIHYFLICYRAL